MNDSKLLSDSNLAKLFARYDGAEGEVLEYLEKHCEAETYSDIQGIVMGYESRVSIPNFKLLSSREELWEIQHKKTA